MTTVNLDFKVRNQFLPYVTREERWAGIVAHRRAGKTVACVMDLIIKAIGATLSEPRFAYICPTYTQAKDIAWSYLKQYTSAIPGMKVSESELSVTFPHNGARIRLYGAENYDRIRGLYLDGVVIDEMGDIDPRAWAEVIRPALSDRKGWATFIGTPKGRNEFYRIIHGGAGFAGALKDPEWFGDVLKASKTGLIAEDELRDARKMLTPEQFAQEYECSFDAAVLGSYYGKEIALAESEKRIARVLHERSADTFAAWDLGIGDSTAIWVFQIIGREWHFIRYYEASSQPLDHYVDWIKGLPFTVHRHILPHDAEARELQTGNSRVEFLEARGFDCEVLPRHSDMDRIDAARVKFNRFWFDAEHCARGIDCLRMYRAEFDEKHKTLKPRPLHDWACFHPDTKVLTRYGMRPIKELPETGEVLTPCGWREYKNPRMTRANAPLVGVVFEGGFTVKCTPDHLFWTGNGWTSAESLRTGSLVQSSLTRSRSISMAVCTAYGQVRDITRAAARSFTETFGRALSALSQRAVISTIETATQPTIGLRTLSVFPQASTCRSRGPGRSATFLSISPKTPGQRPLNGIAQKKAGFGIGGTLRGSRDGQSGSARPGIVPSAALNLMRWFARAADRKSTAQAYARPLRIECVQSLNERSDVWCLTVEDGSWFSLANGAVVHNCHGADAFGYAIMGGDDRSKAPAMPEIETRWVI